MYNYCTVRVRTRNWGSWIVAPKLRSYQPKRRISVMVVFPTTPKDEEKPRANHHRPPLPPHIMLEFQAVSSIL